MTSQKPKIFARIAAGGVCFVGVMVLVGWMFDIAPLKSVVPGWPKVSPITLLAFLVAAVSLWCATATEPNPAGSNAKSAWRRASQAGSVLVALIGLSRLGDYVFGWSLNFDTLGFHEVLAAGELPARMAHATALGFLLIGGALFFAGGSRSFVVFQFLIILTGLIGWLGFSRFLYGGEPLLPYSQMSVLSAVGFLLLSGGAFCVRTDGGLMALMLSGSAGGALVRRLLPPALVIPFFMGWLRLKAQRAGWFGTEAGLSLFALSNVLFFALLIWINARLLHRADLKRQQADEALRDSESRLRAIIETEPECVKIVDRNGRLVEMNPAGLAMLEVGSLAEAQRKPLLEFILPEYHAAFRELHKRVMAGGDGTLEFEVVGANGGRRWLATHAAPLRDAAGKVQSLLGITRDVTERKRAEEAVRESEELFSKAFRMSPDCVAIARLSDRTVIRANEALCQLWGSTPEDVIGKPAREYANWLNEEERLAFMQTLADQGECLNYETTLRLTDARLVSFNISSRMITFKGEACVLSVMRDVTERKQIEAAVARLAAIVQFSDDAIIGKNLEGIVTSWNAGAEKVFGYASDEMVGQPIMRLIPPDRQHEEAEILARVRRGESIRHFDTVRVRKGGGTIDVSVTTSVIKDAEGKIIGASKVARDITARKEAEAAGLASEARYRTLFECAPDGIVIVDPKGYYLDVNASICRMLGYTRAEFIGLHATNIVAPAEIPHIGEALDVIKTKSDYQREWQFRRKDGSVFAVDTIATAMPDGNLLAMIRDITERRQAAQALAESQALYHSLVEQMPAGVFRKDAEGRYVFVNSFFCRIRNASPEQFLGKLPRELPPGEALFYTQAASHHEQIMQTGRPIEVLDEYHRVDGQTLFFHVVKSPVFDSNGKISGSQGILFDVTTHKQLELALRESEERFRTMANSIPQLAWIARADGYVFWYNQRWYEYTGTTPEQMEGWGWQGVHDPAVLPKVMAGWLAAIAAERTFDMEFPLRGANGKFRTFLTRVRPFKDSTGRVMQWFGTNTDVETMKQAEAKIHQLNSELEQRVVERTAQLEAANQELEAFSYSVSHDLRAPLRAVNGFAGIVLEDYSAQLPEEGRNYLLRVRQGSQRMGELIDDLLAFSRLNRQHLNRQTVDTHMLVEGALEELGPLRDGCPFELRMGALPACQGDPVLLRQVWVNLLSNALKYSRDRKPPVVEVGSTQENGAAAYFVRDNGVGFDMQYAGKLFGVFQRLHRADEFEGTGVGLAIVQRIVQRHGGRVWAEAKINQGAAFYFTLEGKNQT